MKCTLNTLKYVPHKKKRISIDYKKLFPNSNDIEKNRKTDQVH